MKIGIITFHWAVNYGAVLQSFALQKVLRNNDLDVEIINYRPYLVSFKQVLLNISKMNYKYFFKMIKINRFIRKNMILSKKRYLTNKQLVKECINYDIYICGSDQVWNSSFALKAEGKPTLSYFLNFVPENKRRMSYAASFGADDLPIDMIKIIKPELTKFSNISVREFSGSEILNNIHISNRLVLDPALLLDKKYYDKLILNSKIKYLKQELFVYIIHDNQVNSERINNYVSEKLYGKKFENFGNSSIGIEEWLNYIKESEFVLTNSYHGMIFSILYKKPFIIVPVEGIPMNNRIKTLLEVTGLQERLIKDFNKEALIDVMYKKIHWVDVEEKLNLLRKESIDYLKKAILNI